MLWQSHIKKSGLHNLPQRMDLTSFPFSSMSTSDSLPTMQVSLFLETFSAEDSLFVFFFIFVLVTSALLTLSFLPSDCSRTASAILWGDSNSFCLFLQLDCSSVFAILLFFLLSDFLLILFSLWKNFTTWSQPRTNSGRLLNNLKDEKNRCSL